MSKVCPNCNNLISSVAEYCQFCGNKFNKEKTETEILIDTLKEDIVKVKQENLRLKQTINEKVNFSETQIIDLFNKSHEPILRLLENKKETTLTAPVENRKEFNYDVWKEIVFGSKSGNKK
ncbi:MAG TPA: hypothetical protein PLC80_00960 [Draconibacterium sp.]|nr:hypothetical protein [Draconibacterium sp.]